MKSDAKPRHPAGLIFSLTWLYEKFMIRLLVLLPLPLIAYVASFEPKTERFSAHLIHEAAIFVAIAQSGFTGYVTWLCYRRSGEPLLRWLALSLAAFAIVYAPHGLLTGLSERHLSLFLVYGPLSRLAMAFFLLLGVMAYHRPYHPVEVRVSKRFWSGWIGSFLFLDLAAGWLAFADRPLLEGAAALLLLAAMALIRLKGIRSSMMTIYMISLAYLAQGSLCFIFSQPWTHLWWLAHFVSACGFAVLSYGVVRAFHTTRDFSLAFSLDEVMAELSEAKEQAEEMAERLRIANQNLAIQASTDPLTGLLNRRSFYSSAGGEHARALHSRQPLSAVAMDLDHFKSINDSLGHAAGDEVLQAFADMLARELRPSDIVGRLGGEEFMAILPETGLKEACGIAERIRRSAAGLSFSSGCRITVSLGVAEMPEAETGIEPLMSLADCRLYLAKHRGRNRVEGGE